MWLTLLLAVGISDAPAAIVRPQPRQTEMEDLSCTAVNDAYVATFSAPALAVKTYGLKADGALKLHDEARYTASRVYEKFAVSDRWMQDYRGSVETVDNHGPIFTACKKLKGSSKDKGDLLHYSATWHGFPFKASYEMWVSPDTGRVMKAARDYSQAIWEFQFPKVVEVFSYNPDDAMPPAGN